MIRKYQQMLLITTLLELFIGGNGYLTEIGGVRLRVWLSLLCFSWVVATFVVLPSTRIAKNVLGVSALFMATTIVGILTGLSRGIDPEYINAELKGLLYFPMIMFFAITIRERKDVELIAKLIVVCGIVQASIFVTLMTLIHTEILNYSEIYIYLSQSDEFIFRHNPEEVYYLGFFYKGAFHLGVALLFISFVTKFRRKFLLVILLIAILLTETRGLLLAFGLAGVAGILILKKNSGYLGLIIGVLSAGALILGTDAISFFERLESDSVRLDDLKWIIENFDMQNLIAGYGMGAFINERSRIEMTYLEILYKQGFIGLSLWVIICILNFITWSQIKGRDARLALAFYLSVLYVYFATITNTFLTGSIGMSIVLLSMVSLNVLRQSNRRVPLAGYFNG